MTAAGRPCKGEFKKDTSLGASYCTHPKAPSFTCPYLCANALCPVENDTDLDLPLEDEEVE